MEKMKGPHRGLQMIPKALFKGPGITVTIMQMVVTCSLLCMTWQPAEGELGMACVLQGTYIE